MGKINVFKQDSHQQTRCGMYSILRGQKTNKFEDHVMFTMYPSFAQNQATDRQSNHTTPNRLHKEY